jgi:putative acetyltransferase
VAAQARFGVRLREAVMSMSEFRVRRARSEESDAVAALHRLSRESAMPFMRGLHTVEEDRAFFRDRVFTECEVWVAEHGNTLVGMCAFRPGWLDHLYVHPAHHGSGIGTTLLRKALAANDVLYLWVFQSNEKATRFYERHGFTLLRTTDGSHNEERHPDALYARYCHLLSARKETKDS